MAYVYVVKANGMDLYKIGIANSADARLESLRTGSPVPLELIRAVHCDDPRWAERFLHDQLNPYRSHGEWFELDDKQMDALFHILNVIADWRPKPNLVSLMVRYGFPPEHAIRQAYYTGDVDLSIAEKREFDEVNSDWRASRAIEMFKAGYSLKEIISGVWGETTGRRYMDASAEFLSIIRDYMKQLERGDARP